MPDRKTETTIQAYNRHAAAFEARFTDYRPYRKMLEAFQARLLPYQGSILDVGCGPGINAEILLAKNSQYTITGIDLSPEMVSLARRRVPRAEFRVADMRNLEPAEKYDVVVAAFCIVHLTDVETARLLEALALSLKSGGALYLSFMEGKPAGFETTSFSPDKIYFNYHTREAVSSILLENGIKTVEVHTADYPEEDGSLTTDVFIFGTKKA